MDRLRSASLFLWKIIIRHSMCGYMISPSSVTCSSPSADSIAAGYLMGGPSPNDFFVWYFFPGRFHHHHHHRANTAQLWNLRTTSSREKSARLSVWAQFYAPLNFFSSNFCVLRVHIFFLFFLGCCCCCFSLTVFRLRPMWVAVGYTPVIATISRLAPATTHRSSLYREAYTGD